MISNDLDGVKFGPLGSGSRWRGRMRYGLFGFSVCVALLAVVVWPFDQALSQLLRVSGQDQGSLLLWRVLQPIKLFGKGDILFLLGWVLAINRWKRAAVIACLALLFVPSIVGPAKLIFGRERPNRADTWSFPSGDTAAITAFLLPIATVIPSTRPIAVAGVAAIGTERVILGKHFPSDVLAGIAIGVFISAVILSLKISLKPGIRRFLRRSWLAAGLWLVVPIRLLFGGSGDMKEFLILFGPAVALLVMAPFVGPWMRALGRARTRLSTCRESILALGLAAILFAGLLFVTTRSALWGRDEIRFAEATVEMIHSGGYLVPNYNGELRPDKPILIYWLMSLPVRIFGPTEVACRLFAPVGAALSCLLTYRLSTNLFGSGAGLMAMAILAANLLFLVEGTLATTDAVLLALMVAAFAVFEAMLRDRPKKIHVVLLALVLGAALLTKGPVGIAIPVLGVVTILLFARRLSLPWTIYLLPSFLLAILVFLAWAIPANQATGGEFLRRGIGYHVVDRMGRPFESHGGNFFLYLPYYIPVVIFGFFPWTLFLPGALSALAGGRLGGERGRSFLLGWMIPTFLLMSLVSTKLPHYVLPVWPALSLAVGGMIHVSERGGLAPRDLTWLARGRCLFGASGFLMGIVLIAVPWLPPAWGLHLPGFEATGSGLARPIAGLGCLLLVLTVLALKEHARGRYRSTVGILLAGMVGVIFIVTVLALPIVERFKVAKPLEMRFVVERSRTSPWPGWTLGNRA